jgi:hypothetical protein
MQYFKNISKDTIALLSIFKKMLMVATIGGAASAALIPEDVSPWISFGLLMAREAIGEFLRIVTTQKLD